MKKNDFKNIYTSDYFTLDDRNTAFFQNRIGRQWNNFFMIKRMPDRIIGAEARIKVFLKNPEEKNILPEDACLFVRMQQNLTETIFFPNIWGLEMVSCFSYQWDYIQQLLRENDMDLLGLDEKSNLFKEIIPSLHIIKGTHGLQDKNFYGHYTWRSPMPNNCLFFFFETKEPCLIDW